MADNNAKRTSTYRFQNISQKYDRLNNIISFEQHKVWRKHVMKEMRVKKQRCIGRMLWNGRLDNCIKQSSRP